MAQNDIYIVRQKSDGTFEEIANSPFKYDATNATDMPDKALNTFHIGTKLRVEELEVNGQTTIIDQDTTTSEQLLVTNDGTGPAAVINQLGTEGIIDIQDDGNTALYVRGDSPFGGFVGLGTKTPEKQLELTGDILLQNNQSIFTKDSTGAAIESIKQSASNILSIQNVGTGGIAFNSDDNLAVKIDQTGKVAIGAGESNPQALLELKRVDDANLRFSHKTSSIIAEANVDSASDFFNLSTITDTDLTLGTNSLPFFTLTKEGNITLEKKTSGSTLTGGDLTIDGTFTSKGDMFSIGDEEILYTKTVQVSGSGVAKSFKFLEFAYNTHDWDSGTAFIIEIFSDYYNAGEYHKYILGHSYLDRSADGSDDGNVDAPGSRDYFLKLTQSYQGHNSSAFRARLSAPESTGIQAGVPPKDIGYVKVYLDLKQYAGARVKVTSLASANSNRISVDAPWSGDDEYKFWNDPQANQEDLVWDDHDPSVEPGDALFASTFYGYSPVNWLGEEKPGAEFEYFLKPADTNISMSVAGKVGIGTATPSASLDIVNTSNTTTSSYGLSVQGGGNSADQGYSFRALDSDGNTDFFVRGDGKVGIGTSDPSATLDVNGSVHLGNLTSGVLSHTIRSGGSVTGNLKNGLQFIPGNAQVTDQYISFYNGLTTPTHIGSFGSVADDLLIRTRESSAALFIKQDGNVGIGTADPNYTLDVNGTVKSTGLNILKTEANTYSGSIQSLNSGLTLRNTVDTDGELQSVGLTFQLKTTGNNFTRTSWIGSVQDNPNQRYSSLIFGTDEGTSAQPNRTEKMRISYNGNVGIGTTQPEDILHLVNGSSQAKFMLSGDDAILKLVTANNTWNLGVDNAGPASGSFVISDNAGTLSSDQRLVITPTGNVGIGTGAPSKQLEISGEQNELPGIKFSHTNSVYEHFVQANDSSLAISADDSTGGNAAGASIRFSVSGPERMRLRKNVEENEGRLNINGDVTDTRYALNVSSDDENYWATRIQNTFGTNSFLYACHPKYGLYVQNDSADSSSFLLDCYNESLPRGNDSNHNNRHAFYVRGDGNVGVGTQHPAQRLHITGDVQIDGDLTIAGASVGGGGGGGTPTGVGSSGDFDMDQMTRLLDTLGLSLQPIKWTAGLTDVTLSEGTNVWWNDLRDYLSHQAYRSFSCSTDYLEIAETASGAIEVRVANGLGADYENPALRSGNINFYVTDLLGRTDMKTVSFNVINNTSDDAPVWNTNNAIYKSEPSTHADKGAYNVVALNADRATRYEVTAGEDQSAFEIVSGNMLRFKDGYGPDYEAPDDTGADRTYVVEVTAYNDAKIGSATATSTPRGFTIYIQDAVQDNIPAWVTSSTHNIQEGNVLSVTLNADRANSYSIVGGADSSLFTITSGNNLTFNPTTTGWTNGVIDSDDPKDQNGNNAYEVIVRAINSNGGRYANRVMVVNVQNNTADDAPVWSQNSVINHMENSTTVVPLTATRASRYTIDSSYADGALFTFRNAPNDTLDFITAPDFESPSSVNGDNTYRVKVIAHNDNSIGGAQAAGIRDAEKIFTIHVVNDVQDDTTISLTYQSTQALLSDTSQPDGTVAFDAESNSIKIWNSSTQTWASFAPNNTIKIK